MYEMYKIPSQGSSFALDPRGCDDLGCINTIFRLNTTTKAVLVLVDTNTEMSNLLITNNLIITYYY